jgi:phenylacetyl-CoA:acceptor oxidoreductase 26-kDa subunit
VKLQTSWDARAALNFMGGGAGAGLMIAAALLPLPSAAVLLALVLIGGGLAAVWTELGKPLRALHVFFNPFTSWMARESFAAVVLFGVGIGAIFLPALLPVAAVVAAGFLYCQARMLQGAKGIPAWRAKATVPLLLATGLAEGSAAALLFTTGAAALVLFAFFVVVRGVVWRLYTRRASTPALESAGDKLIELGTVIALPLALAGGWFPPAAWLAGGLVLATGWQLKLALVKRASFKQGFALPRLPVRGTS